MWKIILTAAATLFCALLGVVNGKLRAKDKETATARTETAKAQAETVAAKAETATAKETAAVTTKAAEAVTSIPETTRPDVSGQITDASNRGDMDTLIRIARSQLERADKLAKQTEGET